MSRARVSIAGLMGLIVMIALSVAALRSPTPLWSGTIFTLSLAALGVSLVGLVNRHGPRRAFWGGFAILGWGYWIAALSPWIGEAIGPRLVTTELLSDFHDRRWPVAGASEEQIIEQFSAVPRVIDLKNRMSRVEEQLFLGKRRNKTASDPTMRRLIVENEVLKGEYEDFWAASYPTFKRGLASAPAFAGLPRMSRAETAARTQTIGHSLIALLSGLVGGMIAVRFHRTRDDGEPCRDDRSNSDRSTT